MIDPATLMVDWPRLIADMFMPSLVLVGVVGVAYILTGLVARVQRRP